MLGLRKKRRVKRYAQLMIRTFGVGTEHLERREHLKGSTLDRQHIARQVNS